MHTTISLSDGEWKIMKIIWEHSPCKITQIVAYLQEDTGWEKHTVITMLGRMEKKGTVYYETGSKAFLPECRAERLYNRRDQSFFGKGL